MGGDAAKGAAKDTSEDIVGAWMGKTFSLGTEPLSVIATTVPLVRPVAIRTESSLIDLTATAGAVSAPFAVHRQKRPTPLSEEASRRAQPDEEWMVQIGTAPSQESARSMLEVAAGAHQDMENLRLHTERVEKNGLMFYRARLTGFDALEDASEACSRLRRENLNCLVLGASNVPTLR